MEVSADERAIEPAEYCKGDMNDLSMRFLLVSMQKEKLSHTKGFICVVDFEFFKLEKRRERKVVIKQGGEDVSFFEQVFYETFFVITLKVYYLCGR